MIDSFPKDFLLTNKVVVVTGASSGIGRACAIVCSAYGAKVVLMGRNADRLEETRSMMKDPDLHLIYSFDLSVTLDAEPMIKDAVSKLGKINAVIHAAGISLTLPFRSVSHKNLEESFSINVYASSIISKLIIKPVYFNESGGSIIFITSVMGMVGEVGKTVYAMTKGALISGVKSMAVEYAQRHIRFNCLSPGVVISPMSQKSEYSKNDESFNKIQSYHPLGMGTPEDVANACLFLVSDASKWITGTNLVVDGGYTCR